MLENWKLQQKPEDEELAARLAAAHEKLAAQQMQMKEKGLPVLVLFEGFGSAGKGTVLGRVLKDLDPRFFRAVALHEPTAEEKRYPFLYRYYREIPEAGQFKFLETGWLREISEKILRDKITDRERKNLIGSVRKFDRSLTDNGYLVLKFFFYIDKKEQKKRMKTMCADPNTDWKLEPFDSWEHEHYEKCSRVYDDILEETDTASAPWYLVDAASRKWAELQVLEALTAGIETACKNTALTVPLTQNKYPLQPIPALADVDLSVSIPEEEYREKLRALQQRLGELQDELYRRKIPVIIAYEGWDAAGKGGNIKRLIRDLDPRGFEVFPIASPKPFEKSRHYLWRFWQRLPKTGHIAVFDRTWYGRVMVERLEGFCSEPDWRRAYNEINEFEKELSDWGAVILKFWVHIDPDTQLARFTERQNTPEKQWKITDEDWRNRDKWPEYEIAVNEMLQRTNTTYAPWHILESNDKHYARIKALEVTIGALEKALRED